MTERDRALLQACIDRYVTDLQIACMEDQGVREGKPGTVGHEMQQDLLRLKETVRAL